MFVISEFSTFVPPLVSVIGAIVSLAGVMASYYLAKNKLGLQVVQLNHEKQKWLLELHSKFESKLHKLRLEDYPPIFEALERLSHFRIDQERPETIRELAAKLNAWGYGRSGLVMTDRTRDSLFRLRNKLVDFAENKIDSEALMTGDRTEFIEWLRRDLNHSESSWRNLPPLLENIVNSMNALNPFTSKKKRLTQLVEKLLRFQGLAKNSLNSRCRSISQIDFFSIFR